MDIYLGSSTGVKADLGVVASGVPFRCALFGPEVTVWLHENEDGRAHLESEDGPLPYLNLREGWRVFLIEGTGTWRARHLDEKGSWVVVYVRVRYTDQRWRLEISNNAWD